MKKLKKLSTHKEKLLEFPILRRLDFSKFSFYTLTRMLLVLVLFLINLMRKVRNMLSPMHPKTTRLKAITFHTRGSVLLLYGLSYISGPIFMALSSFCISTTNLSSGWWSTTRLLVNSLIGRLYFRSMSSRLFIDLILHIRMRIPCRRDPSLPLKIFQKPGKTLIRFQ